MHEYKGMGTQEEQDLLHVAIAIDTTVMQMVEKNSTA